jgi:hypothetical protein
MTKTARRLIADLPAASTPLDGTELVVVEIGERKKKVAAFDLMDYEEGTWTPVVTDGTNNATLSTEVGTYTRIGRFIYFECEVVLSSLGSVSGAVRITGLPIAAAAGSSRGGANIAFANNLNLAAAGQAVPAVMTAGDSRIDLYVWDSTVGTTAMQATELSADGRLIINGSYIAAS